MRYRYRLHRDLGHESREVGTFKKMAGAFLACTAMVILIGLLLRATPEGIGQLAGKLSLVVAALMGWQHTRSLTHKTAQTPPQREQL
jgi:hypothetical protein